MATCRCVDGATVARLYFRKNCKYCPPDLGQRRRAKVSALDAAAIVKRENRYPSHALVEMRKFRFLPFCIHSAVLLDISAGGFKVEFTGEVRTRPGEQFWLAVPLAPLGIFAPSRLICRGECRWFDEKRFRVGGVFMQLTKIERHIIDQIIESLRLRGTLK